MYSHFSTTDSVTPFGLIFIAAIFTAWFFARRNAAETTIDPSHVDLLVPLTIIVGIAGGTVVAMSSGPRLSIFSIVGFGAAGLFVYSRIVRLSCRRLLDIFALPTLAALMVHRIGCFIAGCCWGDVVRGAAPGVTYPPGSLPYEQHLALGLIEPGAVASLPIHPVQLYEAGLLLVLLLVLSRVPWRSVPRGTLTVLAVFSYAVLRFILEYLRADGTVLLGNLTVTQLQCIALAFCIVLLPRSRRSVVS